MVAEPYYPEPQPQEMQAQQPAGPAIAPAEMALLALMQMPNIAANLPKDKITGVAEKVIREYDIDKKSREEWEKRIKQAMDLAMLVAEAKNYPFKNAANIKYPLLTTAALQFNARAYPAVVQGNRVVKCSTWGSDPQGKKAARGERVSEHMSYQLLAELPEWEEDTDKLLVYLPIVGCCFRKVYHDPSLGRNTTRLVTADRLVVNYYARSLEDCPRVTEEMRLYPYEIQERIRSKRFIEFDYTNTADASDTPEKEKPDAQDDDAPQLFLEQHRLLDLDEDGYPEPYIVTVHHATQKVCRIVANFSKESINIDDEGKVAAIRKQQYYVKYLFLPSPDGGFYGMGFGWLLKDIGEAINTLQNQMIDAGHMSVMQGGLVSEQLGIKEKKIALAPGEWRVVKTSMPLNQAVMPINYPGPSAVLFELLGLLVESGKEVAAIKDVLTGEGQGKNASPTTTLALIEQGLQIFTAIYKRIHRAFKAEFGIHARLNHKHVTPEAYAKFFDQGDEPAPMGHNGGPPMTPDGQPQQQMEAPKPAPDPKQDYNEADKDILPISDPSTVSKMQKLAKGEFIWQISQGNPLMNPLESLRRMLEGADVEDIDELIMPPPPPDPEQAALLKRGGEAVVAVQEADVEVKKADAELKRAQAASQPIKDMADVALKNAQADVAEAKIEETASRLMIEHGQAQAEANKPPETDNGPEIDLMKHDDQMALERDRLDVERELGLAKIAAAKSRKE